MFLDPFLAPFPILTSNNPDNLRLAPGIQVSNRLRIQLRTRLRFLGFRYLPNGYYPDHGYPPGIPRCSGRNGESCAVSLGRWSDGVRASAHAQNRKRLVPYFHGRGVGLVWHSDGLLGYEERG